METQTQLSRYGPTEHHTRTRSLVRCLGTLSRQLLEEKHQQLPPFLYTRIEESLIPYLTLVAQTLRNVRCLIN